MTAVRVCQTTDTECSMGCSKFECRQGRPAPSAQAAPKAEKKDMRICHAPGDRCLGCPHYHGKAARCSMAPNEQANGTPGADAEDAARYRFASQHFVLSGGQKFGWPIAPCNKKEWDRYIDAALAAQGKDGGA